MFKLERVHLATKLDVVTWRVCIVVLSFTGVMLLLLPTLIVLATSLNEGYVLRFPPSGLSLRWYVELFREASSDLQEAAITSFKNLVVGNHHRPPHRYAGRAGAIAYA